MAGRKNYDGTLLDVAGQGAPVDGDWFEVFGAAAQSEYRAA
jgi:hypothetical protein